jgi:peptidoglycan/xylan/chitin deacetylase (PgdA/CDA1 family)
MNPEHGGYVPPQETKIEPSHPFRGDLENLKVGEDFEIHKLEAPSETVVFADGEVKEFKSSQNAVTEYYDATGKNRESFIRLKEFFKAAQEELGPYLPKTMFVEGHPSSGGEGSSFYVVQRMEGFADAKKLDELNSKEFSVEFLNQLLDIQERINSFLESHAQDIPSDWIDLDSLDPKGFKEDIVHSPSNMETKVTSMFRLDPKLAKEAFGSTETFEAAEPRMRALKMLGLGKYVEKIEWALERSAAKEWVKGKDVYWWLDPKKMKAQEKEGKKVMALTFDDGPNEETEKLLDILNEKGVKATFFLVGALIPGREHIVKRIVDEGHDVGNHEMTHEGGKMSLKSLPGRLVGPRQDLGGVKETNRLIEQVTGFKPTLGRMAGVHGTIDSLREFQSMGLKVVHGNPYDVVAIPPKLDLPADQLLKKALSSNGHGRIRLFHIGAIKMENGEETLKSEIKFDQGEVYPPDETLKMIGEFIDQSKAQGYDFVQVEENI